MPTSWEAVRGEIREKLGEVLASLTNPERTVLKEVLELERNHRHLNQPHLKGPIKDLIERVVRNDTA